ncbi:MAG: hypothetical protein A3F73_10575 [Gallionellales bacterium RIFCSPLOWO2_12_FULL_59_22]|nr:MAG: hypothetical protein A3F73_10575 [Gallionellales bacterium RIFCSPLOWO2_12_FULL_59_22]
MALLFAFSILILFFASLQYYWPGKWQINSSSLQWKGETLTLMKGQGFNARGGLTIDGLSGAGIALATLPAPSFRAEDYPAVHWLISSDKQDAKVEFLWRTSVNPARVFAREIEWLGNSTTPLYMAGDINWQGQIIEMMLMVHAPLHAPLTIEAVKAEPPLGIVWREWFGTEQWLGTSMHFMGGNESRHWLAPLPFVAVSLGLALLGYAALAWRKILVFDHRMLWALVFLAWFALDMRWQIDLLHKLGLTQQRYAGKSWEEKHLAADDGPLFDLMQQVRAKLPPTGQFRVYLIADDEYIRGRGAYHLYPFNVLSSQELFAPKQFKPGDFIVILGKDEIEFDVARKLLKGSAGWKLSAELLLVAENNVLLKVL